MGRSMQELLIFNALMKHTSDSIVIKEYFATEQGDYTGGKIICASAAKANHYGLNMDAIRGHTDFDLMPRDQAEKALQDDLWVIKNRKPIEDQQETITHKNGETIKVSVTKFPWVLPSGEVVGVMCIARNITIRERAKQQTRDMMIFMTREVLKPLLSIYHNDLKKTKSGGFLRTIISRLIRKSREVKDLQLLASAEQEHYEALMKLEKEEEKSVSGFTVLNGAACIFKPLVEKRDLLAELETDPDAYRHVITEQEESIRFYDDLAAKTEDKATRKLLQMIAEQERKHDNIIKNIYEFMESPRTYLAWGEFSNLKDL